MNVANVTAVQNGKTVLDHEDANDADVSSLLQFGDEIVIHEVHDEDMLETTRGRAPDEWWSKVTMETEDGE